jgi:hypothetical protein
MNTSRNLLDEGQVSCPGKETLLSRVLIWVPLEVIGLEIFCLMPSFEPKLPSAVLPA